MRSEETKHEHFQKKFNFVTFLTIFHNFLSQFSFFTTFKSKSLTNSSLTNGKNSQTYASFSVSKYSECAESERERHVTQNSYSITLPPMFHMRNSPFHQSWTSPSLLKWGRFLTNFLSYFN